MSKFKVVEVPFGPQETKPTLEDEFTLISISRELDSTNDPAKLKLAAINLLMVTIQRQAIIRGLCKRLAEYEIDGIVQTEHKG